MGLDRRAQTEVCATGGRSKVRPVHWELLLDFDRRAQAGVPVPLHWSSVMSSDRRAQTEVCATGGRSKVRPVHWELLHELRSKSTGRSACATTLEFGDEFRSKSTD